MIDSRMSGEGDSAKPASGPLKLPPAVAARIEKEITRLVPQGGYHIDDEGIRHNGLPLMGTIGAVWLLRADGSLWTVDTDLGLEFRPLEESWHKMALVAGTKRYPWLKELLPSRPPDATECADCRGRGEVVPAVFCGACDGLGWSVPKAPT